MPRKFHLPNPVFRMRTMFSLILAVSAAIAIPLFIFLWNHMWDAWRFAQQLPPFDWGKDALIEQIRAEASKLDLPAYEETFDSDDYASISGLLDEMTGISFYGNEDGYYRIGFYPENLLRSQYGSILQRALSIAEIPSIQEPPVTVRFRNGEIASLYLADYHCIMFIYPYIAVSTLLCIAVFLAPILLYFGSRIRRIRLLNHEITLMASGDLSHPVPPTGRDEIGSLGTELDQLRIALAANFTHEEEIRKSNQDLITSMSHDLRTPLTILSGYLDVMRLTMDRPAAHADYLNRCAQKVADIQQLTDRMFEYALVYEVDETPEFTVLPLAFAGQCLSENLEFIRIAGFTADPVSFPTDGMIRGDETMLKRVFTNLFSNILKYGDKKTAVTLFVSAAGGCLSIRLTNGIRRDLSDIASNQIGLKSVQKMILLHQGTFATQQEDGQFTAELTLPLYDAASPA